MNSFFKRLFFIFSLSDIEKKIYKEFKVSKKNKTNSNLILVQCVENFFYFGLFGKIIENLNEKNEIRVEQFIIRSLTVGSTNNFSGFIKSIFLNNRFRDKKWIKLYSSYCDGIAYSHENTTRVFNNIRYFFKAYKIFSNIKDKNSLLDLSIDNIIVGDLIYDSYLRFKPAATVNIKNFYLCIVIWQCIRNIKMTDRYFKENKPKILLTSYSTYIQHGIAVRIAVKYNTKVYSFGNNQSFCKLLTIDDIYHTANFNSYKKNFDKFPSEDKKKYLLKSRDALDNRFKGYTDIATSYMKESAYKVSNTSIDISYLEGHVVIFLHDFFDSPHIYGNMIFPDFLEWVKFTIELLEKNNIPFCLKPHPNQIKDSEKIIEALELEYPKINVISSKITNKQLIDANITLGISVYGTVAHELAYMNIPVILCGKNPHSSYDFCYEAKNISEYENFIKNYKKLNNICNKDEILSFYFMHNNKSKNIRELMINIIKLRKYNDATNIDFNLNEYIKMFNKVKADIGISFSFTNLLKGNIDEYIN